MDILTPHPGTPSLHLAVPDLFGFPGIYPRHVFSGTLPALRALLARGEPERLEAGLEAQLFALLGAAVPADQDLPVAAVTRTFDLGVIDDEWWLRADPVHLIPDRDRLILTDAARLDISKAESDHLCAEIAEVYRADGWLLKSPHPNRWYLCPARPPRLRTTPLPEVVGRDIHAHLPGGEDAVAWRTTLNEVQILLHTAKANESRERAGKPPINSLWFWGGGRLPRIVPHGIARVWSAEPVSLALARLSQTPAQDVPRNFSEWLTRASAGKHLIVLDRGREFVQYGAADDWKKYMDDLERDWFAPLKAALMRGHVRQARLIADTGQAFRLTPRLARRFWRVRRPLSAWCE